MPFVPESAEAVRAFLEAEDIAASASQPLSTAHVLLALFTFPNRAQCLLTERDLDEDKLLKEIRVVEEESRRTIPRLRERAREIASGSGSREVDCLHVLIALTRLRDAFAYRLIERSGISVTALRNIAVSYVTGNMPPRFRSMPRVEASTTPLFRPRTRCDSPLVVEAEPARPAAERPVKPPDEIAPPQARAEKAGEATEEPRGPPVAERAAAPSSKRRRPMPRPSAPARPLRGGAPPERPAAELSALQTLAPTLAGLGTDLTALARQGELDAVVGRDKEMERLIDILGKRRANNPVLVGSPGVGKTAIVEGLAVKIARRDEDVAHLHDRLIVALDTGSLVAGTSLRGSFSERLGAVKAEVAAARRRVVVFVDEVHTLIGAGNSGEGPQDAANELKAVLGSGSFPCIGATTHDEFKKHIEKDPALERRFTPVLVEEPTPDEAILILEGAIQPYAEHHGVDYALEAVHAAVQLSHRFVPERKLPDKAFSVIDLAGSRAHRQGRRSVDRMEVARVIHEWSGVPLERLAEVDADRMGQAESLLAENLIGHAEVVSAVCRAVRRGLAGFNGARPIGSFLFLGPTGVGKTELVKILAEFLFGRRDAVVRIDMSELSERHAVARLIGAQPGYVGYEEGGQLTEALRKRPFQIVLFDEVEKAHPDVLNLLLQLLDEGHLTDSRGRRVSFASTIVVLTSNLGADEIRDRRRGIGFGPAAGNLAGREVQDAEAQELERYVLDAARHRMAPELWGRLDERLVFRPLSREDVRRIAALQLAQSSRALFAEREVAFEWSDAVLDFLLDHGGFSPETGARSMRQTIQRHVEGPVAEQLLAGTFRAGDVVLVQVAAAGTSLHTKRMSAA